MKPAFQMAYEEDMIRKNPFAFRLDIIPNHTKSRIALTPKQQEDFLAFVEADKHFCRYADEIKVLLGTGMRISEFCGLTIADLDFEKRDKNKSKNLIELRNEFKKISKKNNHSL